MPPRQRPGSAGARRRGERRDGFDYFDRLQMKALFMDHSKRIGSHIHPAGPGSPVQASDPSLGVTPPVSMSGSVIQSRAISLQRAPEQQQRSWQQQSQPGFERLGGTCSPVQLVNRRQELENANRRARLLEELVLGPEEYAQPPSRPLRSLSSRPHRGAHVAQARTASACAAERGAEARTDDHGFAWRRYVGGGQAAASFDETPTFRVPLSVSTSSPALFGATQPPSPSTPPQLDGSQTQDAAVEAVVRQIDTDNSGSSAPIVLSTAGA